MKEDIEFQIIKKLQKLPGKYTKYVNKIMTLISAPFHLKLYILIIGLLYWSDKITQAQVLTLCSSQFIIGAIKFLIQRKRPFQSNSDIELREPMIFDPFSFPSGHALNAFMLIFMLNKNFNINLEIVPYLVNVEANTQES
jgi:membrane-associated phospholipid phosphatase